MDLCPRIKYGPCEYSMIKQTGRVVVRQAMFCKYSKKWIADLEKCHRFHNPKVEPTGDQPGDSKD